MSNSTKIILSVVLVLFFVSIFSISKWNTSETPSNELNNVFSDEEINSFTKNCVDSSGTPRIYSTKIGVVADIMVCDSDDQEIIIERYAKDTK